MLHQATLPPPTADLKAMGEVVEDMVVQEVEVDMVEAVEVEDMVEEVPSSSPGWRACLAGLSLGGIIS